MPQGSVLGPLLFILYINDLYHVAKSTHVILFADDTNLFSSHEKLYKMEKELNDELLLINNWFKANNLSVQYVYRQRRMGNYHAHGGGGPGLQKGGTK